MAATRKQFRIKFSEFEKASDVLVDEALAAALLEINAEVWGDSDLADQGQLYLAAHKLSLSPAAEQARLKPKEMAEAGALTTYEYEFNNLRRKLCAGPAVLV